VGTGYRGDAAQIGAALAGAAPPRAGLAARIARWPVWLRAAALGGLDDPLGALARARVDLVLWMPVALGLGIGGYFLWPSEPGAGLYALAALAAAPGLWLWARGAEPLRFPGALMVLVAAGFLLAGARAHSVGAPVLGFRYYGPVEGRIVAIDRSGSDRLRLTLDQLRLERIAPERRPAQVRISLHGDQAHLAPEPGQRVALTGHLQPPNGPAEPGGFDFRRLAWFQGLGGVGYTRSPVLLLAPPDPSDRALAGHRLRMRLSAGIQAQVPGQAGAVAAALITGDRSAISDATMQAMRDSNLVHVISISGLHMGMVAGFVFAALRYGLALAGGVALVWPTKKIAAAVALVAATLYLWVAGPQVATQRAYLMAAVMLVAVLLDRRAFSLRTVALAATALLLWEPESLTEPGFQMSFAATVALILSFGPWGRVGHRLPGWVQPAAMLVLTSLVAGLATAPITAAQFHRISDYGLLANLLAVPAMGILVMPMGVIAALLAPFGLEAVPLWLMGQGVGWMIAVAEFVAGLDGAVEAVTAPPRAVLPLLGLGACIAILARGAGRAGGLLLLGLGFALWLAAPRPALLVAPEGALVGLQTPAGRALSKTGASFVAERWLEADGDASAPEEAAARPGFSGPRGVRRAEFNGRAVVHLTGKAGAAALAGACTGGALVVLDRAAPEGAWQGCELWDTTRLRASGALAFDAQGVMRSVAEAAGPRLWTR
jgi:competence protein ComEC